MSLLVLKRCDVNDDDAIVDGAYHIPMDGARARERMRVSHFLSLGPRAEAVRAPASVWEEVLSVLPGTEASICLFA